MNNKNLSQPEQPATAGLKPEETEIAPIRVEADTILSRESQFVSVESFTQSKAPDKPERNEDVFAYSPNCFVIADGSTAKYGGSELEQRFGKSGGKIAAELVAEAVQETRCNGKELINHVTAKLNDFYARHYPEALDDSSRRFAATMLAARIEDADLLGLRKIPETSESPDKRRRPVSSFDEPTGSPLSENRPFTSPLVDPESSEVLGKPSLVGTILRP